MKTKVCNLPLDRQNWSWYKRGSRAKGSREWARRKGKLRRAVPRPGPSIHPYASSGLPSTVPIHKPRAVAHHSSRVSSGAPGHTLTFPSTLKQRQKLFCRVTTPHLHPPAAPRESVPPPRQESRVPGRSSRRRHPAPRTWARARRAPLQAWPTRRPSGGRETKTKARRELTRVQWHGGSRGAGGGAGG
jgi:hypothetical protein